MKKENSQLNPKVNKEISISFKLETVSVLSFSVRNEVQIKNEKNIVFEIGVANKTNTLKSIVEIIILVKVYSDNSKKNEIGELRTLNTYKVKDLKKLIKSENNKIELPKVLLASIIGISVSTARGILIAKSAGTILSKAVIPVINPTELIEKGKRN